MCDCRSLPELLGITDRYTAFVAALGQVGLGDWVKLMVCPDCGQLWKVDEWDKYQTLYSVKVPDESGWREFDSEALVKQQMIANHGGLTDAECMWAGCGKPRVEGSAYCIDHLYETGARK